MKWSLLYESPIHGHGTARLPGGTFALHTLVPGIYLRQIPSVVINGFFLGNHLWIYQI